MSSMNRHSSDSTLRTTQPSPQAQHSPDKHTQRLDHLRACFLEYEVWNDLFSKDLAGKLTTSAIQQVEQLHQRPAASPWTSFRPAVIHLCAESGWAPCSVTRPSQPVQVTSAAERDWTKWGEDYNNTSQEPAEASTSGQIVQASSASWTGVVPSSHFGTLSSISPLNVTSTSSDVRSEERNPANLKGFPPAARNQQDFCIASAPESLGKPRQGSIMLLPRPNHLPLPEGARHPSTSTSSWRALHDGQQHAPIAEGNTSTIPVHAPLPVHAKHLKRLQSSARTPVNRDHSPLPWQKRLPPGAPPVILTMFQVDVPAPNKKRRAPETDQIGSGPSKRSKNKH